MAKPTPAPVDKAHDVPTVSFRVITDDKSLLRPAGVHSEQARSYGYNDFSDFERPEHYIRFIEPIESELAVRVEYDMDEQDQAWLDAVNAERKKEQLGAVSYEVFEVLIDKLEKEWFNLIKRIPQPQSHMPVEDSKCAICDDGEGENSNAIVFCDGCNLAVHQDCYGVPYIPEGQWLCRKCTVSPENPVSCLFCPNEGGAFKQTTTGHWSHLLCAIWIPELGVGNAIYMEPVEGVEAVPKNRWKLVCQLCKERVGACIQCEKPSCFTAFHVTCARQAGLLMSMKLMGTDGQLKAFCDKHIPADWREIREDDDDEQDDEYQDTEDDDIELATPPVRKRARKTETSRPVTVTTKMARAHAKSYRPGPPIVPRIILNTLLEYVSKVSIHKRHLFIERLCRYWSLKREARRGAPLLKRLHLEPWTATTESREQTEAEKAKKLEFLVALRTDLEKVRLLAELVRKREKEKLRQAQVIQDIVDGFIFPHYATLRNTFNNIVAMDREDLFVNPVNLEEVPDYLDVVKEPMCFAAIEEKLDRIAYTSISEFKRDIILVLDNAMLYNKSETPFHRRAGRIKKKAEPLLAELDAIPQLSGMLPTEGDWQDPPEGTVGNLETSLARLVTLLAPDTSDPTRDNLTSIFISELEKPKSPTPPPSPPAKTRKTMSHADRKKKWEERQAQHAARLSVGGTRATRATDDGELKVTPPPELQYTPRPRGRTKEKDSDPRPKAPRRGAQAETDSAASTPGRVRPMARPERGVLGVRAIPVVTERERREQERQMDLITESLDSKDEYARFNVGWILPEGAKRRRPVAPAEEAGSKTKEDVKPKKEHKEARTTRKRKATSSPASVTPQPGPKRRRQESEELTPAPDRSSLTPPPDTENELTPTPKKPKKETTDEPEKEEESKDEPMEEVKEEPKKKATPNKKGKTKGKDPYPPGTQVWAKVTSYPYFPGYVVDYANEPETVPQSVLDLEETENAKARAWLVRFYDRGRTYGWVHEDRMEVLGVDEGVDGLFLAGKEKGRNKSAFKSSHVKASCKKAYLEAKAALE